MVYAMSTLLCGVRVKDTGTCLLPLAMMVSPEFGGLFQMYQDKRFEIEDNGDCIAARNVYEFSVSGVI